MTRTEAISEITSKLANLSDDRLDLLVEIVGDWSREVDDESEATKDAVAEGLAQAHRRELASDDQVEAAFARFRR